MQVSPSIWGVFIKQGKEREEAFDQVFENLKFLEEELQGKRFFGGEKIGFADLALGWIAERVCVLEEIIGVKIVEEEKFPRVSAWMQEFVKVPIIKESLPPHEKLVTKYAASERNFLELHSLNEFSASCCNSWHEKISCVKPTEFL